VGVFFCVFSAWKKHGQTTEKASNMIETWGFMMIYGDVNGDL